MLFIVFFIAALIALGEIFYLLQPKLMFYATGLDAKFNLSQIHSLWKLAKEVSLIEPASLYYSVESLNECIVKYINNMRHEGRLEDINTQNFLSCLYDFRTHIELDLAKKKGLTSTKYLDEGQKLRLIYKNKGVFYSQIVNNGSTLVIKIPVQNGLPCISADAWTDLKVSVYLWRKNDALYVFDTIVTGCCLFMGKECLNLAHSNAMTRTQKRQSVRTNCAISANLWAVSKKDTNFDRVETSGGLKCVIEDISEDGAMIRVGGIAKKGISIKLQFLLEGDTIIMYGIVRAVEYVKKVNQSRLHFECLHLDASMRNKILAFVYNVLPKDQKEIIQAMQQAQDDASTESN